MLASLLRHSGLRRRMLVTLGALALFRLGQNLPVPGADTAALAAAARAVPRDDQLYGLVDMITGGGPAKLSVLSLGVLPVFGAQLLAALLTLLVPRPAALSEAGPAGLAALAQGTRWLTVGLGALGGLLLATHAAGAQQLHGTGALRVATAAACMAAGTALVLRLGELITERGLGNGPALLLFAQMAAVLPGQLWSLHEARSGLFLAFALTVLAVATTVAVAAVVTLRRAERRIPVQYAKRMIGRRAYGGTSTYIPIGINRAGFTPLACAALLLWLPAAATRLWPGAGWLRALASTPGQSGPGYLAAVFALGVLFAFYVNVVAGVRPDEIAEKALRQGAFVPGIRPGGPTAEYIGYVHARLAFSGALFAGLAALVPMLAAALLGIAEGSAFGVTSLLVLAAVGTTAAGHVLGAVQGELQPIH
ncbi:preprotein translocase subunit SecY [Streptomyces roseus]|uniref:preprotein translocase subunit SecY n=1 Tax=Streptomyces roseus TaxID=66430 RepID=UPI0037F31643